MFVSDAQTFNRSVGEGHVHSSKDRIHSGEDLPEAVRAESEHEHHRYPHPADGRYVYEVAGVPIYADSPMSQEDLEMEEWLITGKMTPAAEEYLKNRQKEERFDGQVIQRVVGPDGKIHTVLVPIEHQYEEGDAILLSELNVPEKLKPKRRRTTTIDINGVEYTFPPEYYTIEDRYERAQYFMKFIQAKRLGISMAEVGRRIATGEIDVSLSEEDKRSIDKKTEEDERRAMLGTQIILPPLSDKPPVKVSLLPDDGEGALPGWMRKGESNRPSASGEAAAGGAYSESSSVSEKRSNEDGRGAPVPTDVLLSPSDLSSVVESTPSPQSMAGLEKRLTPERIEAKLSEGVSADRFDKAQQLIDQHGTEEGLRRLRESDPDAARQFERERLRSERLQPSEPSRNAPDGAESER